MSEEFLRDQLFIPFRQLDSFSEGAGLGASICDNIVKRMNGSLQFVSEVGVGTTASVIIPLDLFPSSGTAIEFTSEDALDLNTTPTYTRIISDELNLLLDSESKLLLNPVITGTGPLVTGDKKELVEKEAEIVMLADAIGAVTIDKEGVNEGEVLVLVVDDNIIAR